MLELHLIRVSHAVACPKVYCLFFEWGWQGGVFIVMENGHFLVFLEVLIIFPKFLVRLRNALCLML